MALILKDMPHNSACNFADDIVIATETVQQHYEALEKLFENIQKLNVWLTRRKVKILKSPVQIV